MRRKMITVSVLVAMLCTGCRDHASQPVTPGPRSIDASDYVFVDVSKPVFIRQQTWNAGQPYLVPEVCASSEKILFDRFTDRNNNGTYEDSIDLFVISADSLTNQDLNHNGAYDPPENIWPYHDSNPPRFDDLNGNGLWEWAWNAPYYFSGSPYVDANLNGRFDTLQLYSVGAGTWDTIRLPGRPPVVMCVGIGEGFRYVSDSGIAYLKGNYVDYPGLIVDSLGVFPFDDPKFLFAKHGTLPLDTTYVDTFYRHDSLFRFERSVTYLDRYATPDSIFADVVRIRISQVYINDTLKNCPYQWAEACFTRKRGLLSLALGDCWHSPIAWFLWWTSDQVDSLPVPMQR